jgi:DNA-binding PadR family transcriptional regulator
MASPDAADPIGAFVLSKKKPHYGRRREALQAEKRLRRCYILNVVKQIKPQDFYAAVVGEFEQLVLLALVRLGNGAYGAAIRREIRDQTGRDAAIGTVYMALGRLEEKKMVASYVGNPTRQRGGRRRRHYLIDTKGEEALGRAYRAILAMAAGHEAQIAAL